MAQITFTIDNEKIERVKDALAGLYPIPNIPDPANPFQGIPQFTKTQWAKECIRQWIVRQVARWEQSQAQKKIAYNEENDLVS